MKKRVAVPGRRAERLRLMTTFENTPPSDAARPVALVTGVGRSLGIGAGIARRLAEAGWDLAFTYWTPYDARMAWGAETGAADAIAAALAERGAATVGVEADLADPASPERVFEEAPAPAAHHAVRADHDDGSGRVPGCVLLARRLHARLRPGSRACRNRIPATGSSLGRPSPARFPRGPCPDLAVGPVLRLP